MTEFNSDPRQLPLAGLRVVEFTHMVMGPTCGMILADLGAEVIKIEPLSGDNTRKLLGVGAGFFSMFNRNKKSLAVNTKDPRGLELVLKLVARADVFGENFKSGSMDRLGLGYEALSALNPGLVYVSHKGFLPGPYEHRTALDEVVQMMGGLAYMTGPEGQPLRAGASDFILKPFRVSQILSAIQHGLERAMLKRENWVLRQYDLTIPIPNDLAGGVAQINVGAHTETEMKERKDLIDDAMHATRAAVEEGVQHDDALANHETVERSANAGSAAWPQFKEAISKGTRVRQAKAWPVLREKFHQSCIVG